MRKLFSTVKDEERRTIRYPLLLNEKEAEAIRASAAARNLSVADFIRRAALGRKAEVKYETQIVLALYGFIQSIREVHADLTVKGLVPVEIVQWEPLIDRASAAIERISQ